MRTWKGWKGRSSEQGKKKGDVGLSLGDECEVGRQEGLGLEAG